MIIQGILSNSNVTPLLNQTLYHWDPMDNDSFKITPSSPDPVDGDPISLFKDKFGRLDFELTQAAPTSQPLYKVVSGKPYLRYDAVDDVMFTQPVTGEVHFPNQAYTLFMIYKNNGNTANVLRYSNGNAASSMQGVAVNPNFTINTFSTGFLATTSVYNVVPKLLTLKRESATNGYKIYTNGSFEGQLSISNVTGFPYNLNIFVGAFRNSAPYATAGGDIGEIICFNRILTNIEQAQIEQYLINKWGL